MPSDVGDEATRSADDGSSSLPAAARAAAVAVALSSISSLVALALLIQVRLLLRLGSNLDLPPSMSKGLNPQWGPSQVACQVEDLDGNDFALLCTDGVMLSIVVVTGLSIIVRVRAPFPPPHHVCAAATSD